MAVVMVAVGWGEGCAAGSGEFTQDLPLAESYADVGIVPQGKRNVKIYLDSANDIDITLYDLEDTEEFKEGRAVVAWCSGTCNKGVLGMTSKEATATYKGMTISYSGYNGVNGKRGNEYIEIEGTTSTTMMMKAFAYKDGSASVEYEWSESQDECCLGLAQCGGSFVQEIPLGTLVTVGEIPPGKQDVYIELNGDNDVDIQIYDMDETDNFQEGQAIVAWCKDQDTCNLGILNSNKQESALYPSDSEDALLYTYSGFAGQYGDDPSKEYIYISGISNRRLKMMAYGYKAGNAKVEYTYFEPLLEEI